MKSSRPYPSFLLAAGLALVLLATAISARAAQNTLAFSDPSKPGTVRISVKMGNITVEGSDRTDVLVNTDFEQANAPVRKGGLRVISESATYTFVEKDNVIFLDTGDSWSSVSRHAEFNLEVPRNTNVVITNGFGGEIDVTDIDGDVEIKSMNGEIELEDITGGVLVETMNGEIQAKFAKLTADKPISFTSMNGEIEIHVPKDAQAKVRLRTQNGAILTDFDEKTLVTATENLVGPKSSRTSVHFIEDDDIKVAVREAVRAGVEAAREAAAALREAAVAAREAAEEEARAGRVERESRSVTAAPPLPPMPP